MASGELHEGDIAPDFSLGSGEDEFNLYTELKKGPVVLYFYPKDFTAGCTAEACGFRDSFDMFGEKSASVVGISADSSNSHRRFIEKYGLQFRLLSDTDRRIAALFGVRATLGVLPGRATFVIDGTGRVVKKYSSQIHPKKHIQEALGALG